jgi:hypothetical protein
LRLLFCFFLLFNSVDEELNTWPRSVLLFFLLPSSFLLLTSYF